jgi:diguanylate cyclase (GGDEF)-like protein
MASHLLSKDALEAVLDAGPAVLLVVDGGGLVAYGNAAARSFFADSLDVGTALTEAAHLDDGAALKGLLKPGKAGRGRATIRLRDDQGEWHGFDVEAREAAGTLVALHCARSPADSGAARHDHLTQLPNRAAFIERLQRSLGRARQRADYGFAVLVVDLDRFSLINNTLGDASGDHVLRVTSERLRACLRPADMVARLGSDQFAIIADNLRPDGDSALDATRVAERIQLGVDADARELLIGATRVAQRIQQHALGSPFELDAQEVFASASIGIALSASEYQQAEEVLRDADVAMHRAKAAGGARHELFDQRMGARVSERLRLESELHRAVERGQFRLCYQPIVDLSDLRITSFECLLRWEHPVHGILQPDHFLHVAEEMGVLLKLTRWLVREACLQAKAWRALSLDAADVSVSVNLASGSFESEEVLRTISNVLDEVGPSPGMLELELTEGAMVNFEAAAATLWELKEMGVDVNIDDFGTGYSSLSYIHKLPITAIKIDQSFTQRLPADAHAENLIRTIVELGHNLKRTVVAEGIETAAQLESVRKLGCDRGQGFLFSQPVDAQRAGALLLSPPWKTDGTP